MRAYKELVRDTAAQADWLLLGLCAAASLYGIVLIVSATRYDAVLSLYPWKQGAAMAAGMVLFLVLSQLDGEALSSHWMLLLVFALAFLSLPAIPGLGHSVGGNRSWISFRGFSLQPAEPVKLVFVLLLARQIVTLDRGRGIDHPLSMAAITGNLALFTGVIFLVSRDAGTALVYAAVFAGMLWSAGLHRAWFALGTVVLLLSGSALWLHLSEDNYWKMRILVCFDHNLDPTYRGFQQTRSLLAIRSGGGWGRGFLHGALTQSVNPSALPARHTDFIFSVCCEEFGMVGGMLLLFLLTAIVLRCLAAARRAENTFSGLVAAGVGTMLLVQVVLNVGMCLFVLPVIGLTLPFVSYGGSSLVTAYAAMGLVSGVGRRGKNAGWARGNRETGI